MFMGYIKKKTQIFMSPQDWVAGDLKLEQVPKMKQFVLQFQIKNK